jgi:hypothetical protein
MGERDGTSIAKTHMALAASRPRVPGGDRGNIEADGAHGSQCGFGGAGD